MARISTYAVSSPAKLTDELLGSDINQATKNFTVQSIIDLTGITAGTDNTLSMFGPGSTLVDSPLRITSGNVLNIEAIDHIDLGYNTYYDKKLKISGEDSATQGHSFDGVQVTGELIVAKEEGVAGDAAVYFRYGNDRIGGIYLDDDSSQMGLSFYVQGTALNPNIVEKISLREGTTIGPALASVVPPENGLQVQGNINADSDLAVRGATSLGTAEAATPETGDNSNNVATTAFVKASIDQVPSGLQYQGSWDADKNIPDLEALIVQNAQYWIVSHDGDTELDSETDWKAGDWAIYTNNDTYQGWQKIDNTSVLSGQGTIGRVPLWTGTTTLSNSQIIQADGAVNVAGILNVGDATGWNPQPQGHRLRVKGDTRAQSAAPGVVIQNDEPKNGSYTRGIFLAQRGIVELGSITDSDVELKVGDQPIVELKSNKVQCNRIITVQDSDSTSKLTIKTTSTNSSIEVENQTSFHLVTGEDRRISVAADGTTKINYTDSSPDDVPLLAVDGGIKIGNNYTNIGQSNLPATAEDAGTLRYWEGPNKVRLEIAMKISKDPDVYQWINIKDINLN